MHHAALQLRINVVRVDRIARVDPDDDAVNFDFTSGVDRHLADACGPTAIAIDTGDASVYAFGQWFAPVSGLGHGLQNAFIAVGFFVVGQQRQAISQRVLSRRVCQFVKKAFADKRIL